MTNGMNGALEWYRRVLALGMLANMGFLVGVFFAPGPILALLHIPAPEFIWPRAVVMLLGVVTVAYIPALIDPVRYRGSAYYTIGARAAGSSFFFIEVLLGNPKPFLTLALYDFSFGAVEAVLLYAGLRSVAQKAPSAARQALA